MTAKELEAKAAQGFPCKDCGEPTCPGRRHQRGWDWYMVHDEIWEEADGGRGDLCIHCLERRLGRRLYAEDFTDYPINALARVLGSLNLRKRLTDSRRLPDIPF